jgi:hypothetical protein
MYFASGITGSNINKNKRKNGCFSKRNKNDRYKENIFETK